MLTIVDWISGLPFSCQKNSRVVKSELINRKHRYGLVLDEVFFVGFNTLKNDVFVVELNENVKWWSNANGNEKVFMFNKSFLENEIDMLKKRRIIETNTEYVEVVNIITSIYLLFKVFMINQDDINALHNYLTQYTRNHLGGPVIISIPPRPSFDVFEYVYSVYLHCNYLLNTKNEVFIPLYYNHIISKVDILLNAYYYWKTASKIHLYCKEIVENSDTLYRNAHVEAAQQHLQILQNNSLITQSLNQNYKHIPPFIANCNTPKTLDLIFTAAAKIDIN